MRSLALALALALLVPGVVADHVFSHRVYITGRVVDADGRPIPDELVLTNATGIAGAPCLGGGNEHTSETGDFSICRHTHAVPAGATVTVTVAGANVTAPIDAALRSAALLVQAPGHRARGSIQGDHTFNTTFRVAGRSFQLLAAPEDVENVQVDASPRFGVNVTVSLANATKEVKLDEWGSYVADLEIGDVPLGARVTATAGNSSWSADASPLFRRAHVDIVRAAPEIAPPRPGASVPAAGLALVAGVVALTAVASRRR